jgi:hypothetical protein
MYRRVFLVRYLSKSKHVLMQHHCSEKCLGVLPYFRGVEKHPFSLILRSDQLFDHPSGPKLPNLATGDQGDCGR